MANTSALYVRIDTEAFSHSSAFLQQAPFECFTARLFVKTVFL